MTQVAFIGLGAMGAPMAANLAQAGHDLRGFDLSLKAREAAAGLGASVVSAAAEAVADAAVVVTMLQSGAQVLAVWRDIAPLVAPGALLIDCSTIDVDSARRAHALAEEFGALALDAPVSGGVAGAQAAALTFMCGGGDNAFAAARPLLEAMGKQILHCGGPGLGQAAKICNNLMLGAAMIATCEAFVLGEKLGLSPKALFDAASVSSGQSWSLTRYCPAPGLVPASPANAGYKAGFMTALMLKDLNLAQEAARTAGAATPLGALCAQLYALYKAQGNGETDFSGIIEMIRGKAQ